MLAHAIENLGADTGLLFLFTALICIFALRYMIFAGGALALIAVFQKRLKSRRLQPQPFSRSQLKREAAYSLMAILVFTSVAICMFLINERLYLFQIYNDIHDHGWVWFALSIPSALLVHDFYFYCAHRLMHLPGVFERVHKAHHLSTNPSPLSAFAFHPLEAVVEAVGIIVVLMTIPLHPLAFLIVSTIMIAVNVMGHLGYEILWPNLLQTPAGRLLNTATSHNQHHRTFGYNFGLYTTIWDRLFGTLHPRYEETYSIVTTQTVVKPAANQNQPFGSSD